MRAAAAGIVAASILMPQAAAARDALCVQLSTLEQAPFLHDDAGKAVPRTVTLLLDANGFGCRRDPRDGAAKVFCGWLSDRISAEFSDATAERLMACHGVRWPGYVAWRHWKGHADLPVAAKDRTVSFDVDIDKNQPGPQSISGTVTPSGMP